MNDQTILIVDDNPTNLKLAQVVLEVAGYPALTASDAEETLELLRTERPALILLDLQLPGMDGLELVRRLKASPATRDIVVVAVTAYAMRTDEEKARAAGCDGFVTKPIDTRTLAATVAEFLQGGSAAERGAS